MELRQLVPFFRVLCRVLRTCQTEFCRFDFPYSGANTHCLTNVTSQGPTWGPAGNNSRLPCPRAVLILKPQAQNVYLLHPQCHVTAQASTWYENVMSHNDLSVHQSGTVQQSSMLKPLLTSKDRNLRHESLMTASRCSNDRDAATCWKIGEPCRTV